MANQLPHFVASLSKYFRVEDHYALIASISNDTPESVLSNRFDRNLYVTAKQRYLIVKNGIVIRDKLIDLVHEENGFTERVKMVMYFLFMFRDSRYREFICNEVGRSGGKWRTSIFREKRSEYFSSAGGRKAFTNLRQFLFQTGILDEYSLAVRIPELSRWFPAAVQIAAQSIDDATARKNFLASPHGFLIRYKINALLNATPEELSSLEFGGTYEEAEDLLPPIELPEEASQVGEADFKIWNRIEPSKRRRNRLIIETDPAALERANGQHFLLEKRIYDLCKEQNLIPQTNKHIDLAVDCGETSVVFEMKSCGLLAIRSQLRRAISQLLEYRFIYRNRLKPKVVVCAVLERRPRNKVGWLIGYLDSLEIGLIWKNDQDDRLNCPESTANLLRTILPQVDTSNF